MSSSLSSLFINLETSVGTEYSLISNGERSGLEAIIHWSDDSCTVITQAADGFDWRGVEKGKSQIHKCWQVSKISSRTFNIFWSTNPSTTTTQTITISGSSSIGRNVGGYRRHHYWVRVTPFSVRHFPQSHTKNTRKTHKFWETLFAYPKIKMQISMSKFVKRSTRHELWITRWSFSF